MYLRMRERTGNINIPTHDDSLLWEVSLLVMASNYYRREKKKADPASAALVVKAAILLGGDIEALLEVIPGAPTTTEKEVVRTIAGRDFIILPGAGDGEPDDDLIKGCKVYLVV